MASKFAKYRGQRFKVIKEDEKFVTLGGYGYEKRHLKDEVIFEEIPEDKMLEPKEDVLEPPKPDIVEELPKERADLEMIKDAIHDKKDPANEPVADVTIPVVPSPESAQTPGIEKTTNYPNFPKLGIDVTSITPEERDEENAKRRADSVNKFRKNLEEMLSALDSAHEDPVLKTMEEIDKLDGLEPSMVSNTAMPVQPLAEDGGTVSVAGAGCGDGTQNPAPIATQGIATFKSRLGMGTTKRKD